MFSYKSTVQSVSKITIFNLLMNDTSQFLTVHSSNEHYGTSAGQVSSCPTYKPLMLLLLNLIREKYYKHKLFSSDDLPCWEMYWLLIIVTVQTYETPKMLRWHLKESLIYMFFNSHRLCGASKICPCEWAVSFFHYYSYILYYSC